MIALPAWLADLGDGAKPQRDPAAGITMPPRPAKRPPPAPVLRIAPPVVVDGDDPFRMARPSVTDVEPAPDALAYVPAPLDAELPVLRLEEGPAGNRAQRLEGLVDKALDRVGDILDLPFDAMDDNFPRVLGAVKDTAISVVGLQMKADENAFRAKSTDGLLGLLKTVLEKETQMIDVTPTEQS